MEILNNTTSYQKVMEEEPLSPGDGLFHADGLNCCILTILGFKTEINIDNLKNWTQGCIMNHSRFRSVLVGNRKWIETNVDIENHIINVDFDPKMECSTDEFLENYMSNLSVKSMDLTKPLWELHILNVKTCYANSIVLFRVHHSMGDGLSLISLLLASSFQTSNPEVLPSLPTSRKNINKEVMMRKNISSNILRLMKWLVFTMWYFFMLSFNTLVDMVTFLATISFMKDTNTPIKGAAGVELTPKRFVHKIISLDDIKMVKAALNMTVNDVVLGVTQGGLSHYLNRRYGSNKNEGKALEQKKHLPNNIRLRISMMFSQNTKTSAMEQKSKVKLGNSIGFALLPLTVDLLNDPIDHVRIAKSRMNSKKLSLESRCTYFIMSTLPKLFGMKFASAIIYKAFINTSMLFSNVPGPTEEISMFEHRLAYIAPTIHGLPHALTIHFQSYCNKMAIVMAVDSDLIPDPHKLCDDIENYLETIKQSIM